MNVLFVGYGSIARKHHEALLSLDLSDLTCFALRSRPEARDINGIQSIYSWNDLPDNIDFTIVATPTSKHTEALRELVPRGIPIFLEKPVSHTLEGLEELKLEILRSDLTSYVACNLRFLPCLQFLKGAMSERLNEVNEVNIYAGSYLPDWRPNTDYSKGYSAQSAMGGGVHLDLFHELDYTYWIFGNPSWTTNIKRKNSSLDITSVDFAVYHFVYEGFVASIALNYYRKPGKRSIEIVFENEIWQVDLLANTIVNEHGHKIFSSETGVKDTYVSQMKYFTDCLLKKQKPTFNEFTESVEILKICLKNDETGE